ncbi:hypothetical protein KOI35_16345 [Actinoplanes bogorensis]|uniref:Peptidase MA-like domain-containing protein n=1 Tax=Paractinoplanes bogorensis TaxID=1610840 RepID=A0ABS5YQS8_9ACTN|nr:hypothetical protein [Actinoplanes bogorensis]MBU2665073.1 hypothetical protein [Actinoplanes bogorensis]
MRRAFAALLVVGVLALTVGLVVSRPERPRVAIAAATKKQAVSPYERAVAALDVQSQALLAGDEAGWLAVVDAPLKARYRNMFRSLRALDVTSFVYKPGVGQPVKGNAAAVVFRAEVFYCLGPDMCPAAQGSEWQGPPHIEQRLTMRPVGGQYVIGVAAAGTDEDPRRPAPWESGELVALRGTRVTLFAAPAERRYLTRVLPVAEAAAKVDDRFAALIGTPQSRYRIYLAGEAQWRKWYGGNQDDWAIGLAVPLNMHGIDVMLRMKELDDDPLMLRVALQHELGHVVTLSGAYRADAAEDTWLSEGIAEYIGWSPASAARTLRRDSVRWQLRRKAMTTMIPEQPRPSAPARAGDAFYGLSHLAVDCMAKTYGERKLLTFVRLVLTQDNELDQAAGDAYGVPFATVDRACVKWTRQQML